MPIPVALVEDHATLRQRFTERLGFFPDVELTLAVGSGEALLDRLGTLPEARRPRVVLMDIELPQMSGIDATALLKRDYPAIDVIMLTVFEQEDKIFRSIQAGAVGYLLKDASADRLVAAILEVDQGGAPMSAPVARKLLRYVHDQPPTPAPADDPPFELTPRETEVLEHIVQDETEREMAEALHISPHTVRTHVKNIYKKLHVHSRAAAVRVALENRLL
ncbi:MAG: response regulator [Bacteroidetes bacterium]|jgi:DNA-binding NarL/FixJ family response regulator|nr:response regulator [Bacteroidota bacterium]